MRVHFVVIDDVLSDALRIKECLLSLSENKDILPDVSVFLPGAAVSYENYDVFILDIDMKPVNGFDLAKIICEKNLFTRQSGRKGNRLAVSHDA